MTGSPPKVFISYSHDTVQHQERVLGLADRLRADGIDAEMDQYNASPPEGWPLWCERQIAAANVVLMVCTETYHRRVSGGEEHGKGLGVVWEARIIRQLLYDAGAVSDKFVPVLFSDASPEHIPTPIKGGTRYVIDTEGGYEDLYRRLTEQPLRPALGTIRPMPTRASHGDLGQNSGRYDRIGRWREMLARVAAKAANGSDIRSALLSDVDYLDLEPNIDKFIRAFVRTGNFAVGRTVTVMPDYDDEAPHWEQVLFFLSKEVAKIEKELKAGEARYESSATLVILQPIASKHCNRNAAVNRPRLILFAIALRRSGCCTGASPGGGSRETRCRSFHRYRGLSLDETAHGPHTGYCI